MKRPFPLRSVNESVGALVLGSGIVLLLFIVLTIRAQDWFKPELSVQVLLPEGGTFGLVTGADVEVLGAVAGSVEDISIDPSTERLVARVLVRGDFRSLVRGDSRVIIERKLGLAGDAFLSIIGGTRGLPTQPNQPLTATTTAGLMEGLEATLEEVSMSLIPAIGELRELLRQSTDLVRDVRRPDGRVMSLLADASDVLRLALEGEGLAARFMRDPMLASEVDGAMGEARQLLRTLRSTSSSAQRATEDLAGLVQDLRREIPGLAGQGTALMGQGTALIGQGAAFIGQGTTLIDKAGGAIDASHGLLQSAASVMEDVKRTTGPLPEVSGGLREQMRDVPEMVLGVQENLREFERLVEALQRHWLVRGYLDEEVPAGRISPLVLPVGDR